MKRLDALIARQKTRTHFNGPFLKKWDLTIKKVQKNWTLIVVFPDFHQIGPLGRFDLVIAMSVCLCVCLSLFMWYILRPILPPLPKVQYPKFLEIRNPWGKVLERSGIRIENFVGMWSKIAAQKKVFFCCWFCLTKHGGNHASRWIRDLWSKVISLILAYL